MIVLVPVAASARRRQPDPASAAFAPATPAVAPAPPTTAAGPLVSPAGPAPTAAPAARRPLDFSNPYSSSQGPKAPEDVVPHRLLRPRVLDGTNPYGPHDATAAPDVVAGPRFAPFIGRPRRVLDPENPYATRASGTAPEAPPAVTPQTTREAIKAAVDAGDLERAAKLLEMLRRSSDAAPTTTP